MLDGKRAVVTGSTSGVGLGIARVLAEHGAMVTLNGLGDAAEIKRVMDSVTHVSRAETRFDGADLSWAENCQTMIARATKAFGGIDILVNNVGIQATYATEAFPADVWDRILAVNLSSYFHTIKAALPGMQAQGFGRIINIASVHGLVASIHKAAYVASKHGVVGLSKVVALENADKNITCNAICPGWVDTPLIAAQIKAHADSDPQTGVRALLAEKQPSKRFSTVQDIGALAAFLCSEAAHNITGCALPMDGGWTAQ